MKAFGLADEEASAAVIEVPIPEPGPGEVRIRVRGSSVNGFDVFVAKGFARGMMEHRYPVVGGKDYAGMIESVGEGVTGFAVGDEVVGITPPEPYLSRGSYAEIVVVPAEGFIERKPANLDFEQAASVGLAAVTALASVEAVDPSDGDVVLVVGAAGGVGAYAVQLAARRGATVVATSLPKDAEWIRGLGASEVVDYSGNVAAAVRETHPSGVDALIVAVHLGDAFDPTAALVKSGGRVASTIGGADAESLAARGIAGTNVMGQSDPGSLGTVLRMAEDGTLVVPITRTYATDWIQISRHGDDGTIVETWAQMDLPKMMVQLGAMQAPEGM
jgi:NADPH:quinone reductase-like Zn-dependent oxidoreductase